MCVEKKLERVFINTALTEAIEAVEIALKIASDCASIVQLRDLRMTMCKTKDAIAKL